MPTSPRPFDDNSLDLIGRPFNAVDTPAVIVDLDVVEANVRRFQAYCDEHGLRLRPHIKTHKIPEFAALQMKAGAVGINCQKIGEAEVMVDAGMSDILITFNILGAAKLARLRRLAGRCALTVTADSETVVAGLAEAMAGAERPLDVLVECDTGAGRCGVQSPEAARDLARRIAAMSPLRFKGLMTYPKAGAARAAADWLAKAKALCEEDGLPCPVVSSGGTPDMWGAGDLDTVTEYRVGTYIYNDRSLIARKVCTVADCALNVLATVVSRPTAGRAIIDAGSKALTSDLLGLDGHGFIPELPEASIHALSEEHGFVDLGNGTGQPSVGDKIRVIPNHACVVSNLVDRVYAIRGGKVSGILRVQARGCSQ
ncbi:MAG: D-TA family PLP-dependent enzyme [Rhodospirillales bacterium]|nr:D-TA family PLP-dependent enzyme [Rhodospirillales bacterium]